MLFTEIFIDIGKSCLLAVWYVTAGLIFFRLFFLYCFFRFSLCFPICYRFYVLHCTKMHDSDAMGCLDLSQVVSCGALAWQSLSISLAAEREMAK